MAVIEVVALRGPGGLALLPPAALLGLAFERRADLPGPRRGVAQKRRERHTVLKSGVPATVFTGHQEEGPFMAVVMIGIDPHKASHTAVAISAAEEPLGELRGRARVGQGGRGLAAAAGR